MENHVKLVLPEYVTLGKQSSPLTLIGKGTASEQEQLEEGGMVVALEEGKAQEEEKGDVKKTEHRGTIPSLPLTLIGKGMASEQEQQEEGDMVVALEEGKTEEEEEEVDVKKTEHRGTIPVR